VEAALLGDGDAGADVEAGAVGLELGAALVAAGGGGVEVAVVAVDQAPGEVAAGVSVSMAQESPFMVWMWVPVKFQ
jgi:hypothetical protein